MHGVGVDENDVYHAALRSNQTSGPANRDWEIRVGLGGQIYSIRSEVGEIVPPQSTMRPFNDEVFQAVSVNTGPTHYQQTEDCNVVAVRRSAIKKLPETDVVENWKYAQTYPCKSVFWSSFHG